MKLLLLKIPGWKYYLKHKHFIKCIHNEKCVGHLIFLLQYLIVINISGVYFDHFADSAVI